MTATHVRRRQHLFLVPVDKPCLDFAGLLSGHALLGAQHVWEVLVSETGCKCEIDAAELEVLLAIGEGPWSPWQSACVRHGQTRVVALVDKGLLEIAENPSDTDTDPDTVPANYWHPLNMLSHTFSRWSRDDIESMRRQVKFDAVAEMVEACGLPPPHFHYREDSCARVQLDDPVRTGLDDLLQRRATCRNFDRGRMLPRTCLATLLKRVFGVHGLEEWAPGAVAVKKNHPSGGALHPVEAYLLVQRAQGLDPGLYHYNVEAHALDLLQPMAGEDARAFAATAVAGQDYFADAPVMVVMAARFARSMWKYRNHPKIYRAILLEMGHISQNLYLTATEMNLGAFITAAINEVEIEQAFGLEPMTEGPLCVCGFGARAAERVTVEFDPAHKVWGET